MKKPAIPPGVGLYNRQGSLLALYFDAAVIAPPPRRGVLVPVEVDIEYEMGRNFTVYYWPRLSVDRLQDWLLRHQWRLTTSQNGFHVVEHGVKRWDNGKPIWTRFPADISPDDEDAVQRSLQLNLRHVVRFVSQFHGTRGATPVAFAARDIVADWKDA